MLFGFFASNIDQANANKNENHSNKNYYNYDFILHQNIQELHKSIEIRQKFVCARHK